MDALDFVNQARRLQLRVPGAVLRVRKPTEQKSFDAYLALPARWGDEKRIVLLVLASGKLIAAVAPPTPHPLCVSRGRDEEAEARAVDEALYELGSRYTSWCRVLLPPGLRVRENLEDIVSAITSLGIVDDLGWLQ